MSSITREKVLVALEQACRHGVTSPWVEDLVPGWKGDEAALVWGPGTSQVVDFCLWSTAAVRRELDRAHADGLVLCLQRREGGPKRWWPVGLLAKLQAECASAAPLTCDDIHATEPVHGAGHMQARGAA